MPLKSRQTAAKHAYNEAKLKAIQAHELVDALEDKLRYISEPRLKGHINNVRLDLIHLIKMLNNVDVSELDLS